MSHRLFLLLFTIALAGLLLAACAAPATSNTTNSTNTPQAQASATPEASGAEDVRVYRIVPDQSTASYSVSETLFNQNNRLNVAVGKTSSVNGEVMLDFTHPERSTAGLITVDISTLASDSGMRDNRIRQQWLESAKFPIATFKTTSIQGLPSQYTPGADINFKMTGDLTVRDTTRPVTFDVTARLDNDKLTGKATTQIQMTDFNFSPPDMAGILKVENNPVIELDFTAVPK